MPRILCLVRAPRAATPPQGAEVVWRAIPGFPLRLDSAQDWALADLATLAAGQGAAAQGFDAVCVGEIGDFGAAALRSLLSIPVLSAGRCGLLYGLTLGARVGLVAPQDCAHRLKKLVVEYGLQAQCAGVRGYDPDGGMAARVAAARHALEVDGADALCVAGDADAAGRLAAAVPAPVIEPTALTIELAACMLGLGLSHSPRATPPPQSRKPELIAALARAAAAHEA